MVSKVRNIGISAHIDAGKTTTSERILYYTRRIHAIHDVKGKDGVGATMDFMELERERGITITSAATYCQWKGYDFNIIDTPGHVDFTVEVERSLRILDGAVLVLCSVGGVQSQSITVDKQMARYHVPCIAFINKCDRTGANPLRVVEQLREKLGHNAIAMQLPIGLETEFAGVVDLVKMKALYFEGEKGDDIREAEIPDNLKEEAAKRRQIIIEEASNFSDELMEAALEDESSITEEMLNNAIRVGTLQRKLTPVFMGTAYKNKGIQPMLDGVNAFLPAPEEVVNTANDLDQDGKEVVVSSDPDKPCVALSFKLDDGPFGQLTYIRVYQGTLRKNDFVTNVRTGKKIKVGRIARMHADTMEDVSELPAGYIGALFGVDCASGDTFVAPGVNVTMTPMHVPEPVISMAITPVDNNARVNMTKALTRFTKEDPTFRVKNDETTNETIISGMGELHLEVYIERMKREYKAEVNVGQPKVAYRETITKHADFNYLHKKQTGGSGQFARVAGYLEPCEEEYVFDNQVVGGAIPTQFIGACDKGFRFCMEKGPLMKCQVIGVKCTINDGAAHAVDSSDIAFQLAARGGFAEAYMKAAPVLQEPIMKVVVETPTEYQGALMGTLNQRRGLIVGTQDEGNSCVIEAQVPLSEMFGYSTVVRSNSQGKAQFTMEFSCYRQVPNAIAKDLLDKFHAEEEKKNK